MRFEMARAGERVDRKTERNGQQVRDMYEQVLLEDPNHPKADLASLRLGELYDHIILRDSVRDPNKAIPHFKRVIDKAKKKRERQREGEELPETEVIELVVLRCYIHLGNIYAERRQYDKARKCYETIYTCQPSKGEESRTQELQTVARDLMIGDCIRPDVEESMALLDQMVAKYAGDSALRDRVEWQRARYLEQVSRSLEQLSSTENTP